jgi:ribosomal protein L7/L12
MTLRVIVALLLLVPHYACQKHDGGGPGTYQVVIVSYDQHQRRKALLGLRDNAGVSVVEAKYFLKNVPSTVKKGLSEREAYSLARKLKPSGIKTNVTKE